MTNHKCHAFMCEINTPQEWLMCKIHWRRVPKQIQEFVWKYYRVGQCDDKRPSKLWMAAADWAILAVRVKENLIDKESATIEVKRIIKILDTENE